MGRDLGRMGETPLRSWAAQIGVALNKSDDQDTTGWDFFLEWPSTSTDPADSALKLPLDRRPAPLQCLIQVKATDTRRRRWSVKLSNWLRLIRSPLPAFLLVLEYDGANDCQRAFLVHVGEDQIRLVQKRLREIAAEEPSAKLHKRMLDFSWGDQDQLRSLDGVGLDAAVRSHVGGDIESYTKQKMTLVDSVGYEDGGFKFNVRFRLPEDWSGDPEDLLVAFALGTTPHLEITGGEMIDVRFGIPVPELRETIPAGARLEIVERKSAGKGRIKFRAPAINKELTFSADTYLPHGFASILDERKLRGRFVIPFVDFVFGFGGSNTVNFKLHLPDPDQEHALAELQPAADLILFLDAAVSADTAIKFEMQFEGHALGKGGFSKAPPLSPSLLEWANVVQHAWTVARFFGFDQESSVRLSDLVYHRDPLLFLHTVLSPGPAHIWVDFSIDKMPEEPEKPWCVPLVAEATVGQHRVQVAIAAVGEAVPTGELDSERVHLRIVTNDVRRYQQHYYVDPEKPEHSAENLQFAMAAELEKTMNVVMIKQL